MGGRAIVVALVVALVAAPAGPVRADGGLSPDAAAVFGLGVTGLTLAAGLEVTVIVADFVYAGQGENSPWEWAVVEMILAACHLGAGIGIAVMAAGQVGTWAEGDDFPNLAALELNLGAVHLAHAIVSLAVPPTWQRGTPSEGGSVDLRIGPLGAVASGTF